MERETRLGRFATQCPTSLRAKDGGARGLSDGRRGPPGKGNMAASQRGRSAVRRPSSEMMVADTMMEAMSSRKAAA